VKQGETAEQSAAGDLFDLGQSRRQRRLYAALSVPWAGYLVANLLLGRPRAAAVNAVVLGASAVVVLVGRGRDLPRYEAAMPHLIAAVGAAGLVVVAEISGQGRSPALWFLVFFPLLMGYMRRTGEAVVWLLICVLLFGGVFASGQIWPMKPEFAYEPGEVLLLQAGFALLLCGFSLRMRQSSEGLIDRQLVKTRTIREQAQVLEAQAVALAAQARELELARDQALAAARAKSEFLATMSHEIRTPLNAVVGMTSLLRGTPLGEAQLDYVSTIEGGSEALLALISDILDLSKLEAGRLEPEAVPFDVLECIEGAIGMVATQAQNKGLELLYELSPAVPSVLVSDPGRIRQILVNLLSNAVKFTAEGQVELTVSSREQGDQIELIFVVQDSGVGIPEDRQHLLFHPFQQLDASTTRKYGGTGLGLAICHALATLLGGRVTVTSQPGVGSCFTAEVKARRASESTSGLSLMVTSGLAGRRLALAIEQPRLRQILTGVLERAGASVDPLDHPEGLREALVRGAEVVVIDPRFRGGMSVGLGDDVVTGVYGISVPVVMVLPVGGMARPPAATLGPPVLAVSRPVRPRALVAAVNHLLSSDPPSSKRPARAPRAAQGEPLRVLVAEDNLINQKVVLRMLERLGHQADVVDNGRKAIAAVEGGSYDVVLMDVQMPEMDGLEAAQHLVSTIPRDRRPRLIGLTANALPGDRERCLAAGMDLYLSKPLQLEELGRALRSGEPLDSGDRDGGSNVIDVIDPNVLAQLQRGGDGMLEDLVGLFTGQTPSDLDALRLCFERGDTAQLLATAHSIKGSSSVLGVVRVYTSVCVVEQLAHTGGPELSKAIHRLDREYRRAETKLLRLIKRRPGA
jgi:signal transduction histidine kinase/CheY-like chemotaxis protein